MELKLGKMSGKEIATWMNISYDGTYRKNPSKYLSRLSDYCKFEQVRGGAIINEIYIATYDKDLNKKVELDYVKALSERDNGLMSISGLSEENGNSRYLNTKARNHLFGPENRNVNSSSQGILGYREAVWSIKLSGPNNYRDLTPEENELFDALITKTYGNLPAKEIKAQALLLEFCVDEGMSAKEYKDLMDIKGLNFFGSVIDTFKSLTSYQLAKATSHTIINDFELSYQDQEYRDFLLNEIKKLKDNEIIE